MNWREKNKDRINANIKLVTIKQWFQENDWKVNKIVTGEWQETDERWTSYLEERTIKRAEQDKLVTIMNTKS